MAKQTVSEEEIQLRKRARRRLVGAVALAVLAAIVLPMVFDDQVKQVGNVQIQIPDEKSAAPFEPGISSSGALPAVPAASIPASAPPSAEAPHAAPEAKPAEAKPAPAKPAEAKPAPAKQAEQTGKTEYIVQIGVFSNAENVRDLRKKLASAGIHAYVEAVGDKTRVRAGPYPSRSAAEIARKRIAKSGLSGVVETLQP